MTELRGMTWAHRRGLDPLLACSADYERTHGVTVRWEARSLQDFADFPLKSRHRLRPSAFLPRRGV